MCVDLSGHLCYTVRACADATMSSGELPQAQVFDPAATGKTGTADKEAPPITAAERSFVWRFFVFSGGEL